AVAVVESGIDQTASASAGDQVSASASLVNSGTLRVAALAEAIGANAYARASIVEEGIDQRATDADDAAVTLVSTSSGTIDIVADAKALATSGPATATAYIDSGIYQYANAGDDEQSTLVTLSNAGTIRIQALAHATGTSGAVANADIDRGVSQSADGAEESAATLTNSGLLDIRAAAWALATATTGIATANASIAGGIFQFASPDDNDEILGEV